MPSCTVCLKNMEGITEMYVSRKCHKVFCGACLDEFSKRDNDRFTCPTCRLIHSKLDFHRIVSPLENIDEEKPRDREEALVAYERSERRILDARPDWAALFDMMDAKLASLKASHAEQLRLPDSPETIAKLDAAIANALEKYSRAIVLVRELESKAKVEQAKVGVYREELARVTAQADAKDAALQELQDNTFERLREICEEYARARSMLKRKNATREELSARNEQVQTLVSVRRLRVGALQRKNNREQEELYSLELDPALAIFKVLRRVGCWLSAFVVLVVFVLVEVKVVYEYSVAWRLQ
ncbi:uncharacterized protein SCHCODRAFT_01117607 [Schizophyllum commune H4-8]|nr:uncharacterized protein SCHCODRAFT_01117607 [Schizophyllum commune H4-8]KAI5900458.1 hypothetical protein SCHCODRAFT_01117607 [Schizophyllum commune H4-8]